MDRLDAMLAYVRLVELGSFSKVGLELRVKQSTVSKWIANLETQLHTQLIERTSRSQRVTEAGQLFYERAKDILASYEELEAQLQQRSPVLSGRIRVNAPVVFGRLYLLPHLGPFLREHPSLEVELVLEDRYIQLLEEGIDLAIRVGKPVDSSLRSKTLATTPRRLVAAPQYLEEFGEPTEPKELKHHNCLLHSGLHSRAVWQFSHGNKTFQTPVSGRFSANNSEALVTLAKEGLGIALLASWLVDDEIAQGHLTTLLPNFSLPMAPIQALLPPSRQIHPRVRAFLNFLEDTLAPLSNTE
ncbi:MAG: LysR family transcriptional regulator [Deltaproteobacteria bacterium]|nr:MAG: LysR family transcriptional regulator [Deltaproteobacteria bacterium]